MSARRSARRRLILASDVVLTRIERIWVDVVGGRRRRREGRNVDPVTGRTSLEHLRRTRAGGEILDRIEEALDRGVPEERVTREFERVTGEAAQAMAASLQRAAPQMLREHRALHRGMQRRLRALWGPALDAFYEVYVCVEELGSDVQQLHATDGDALVGALLGLHARSCLVLREVHALMAQGFPLGAWARTRTLHEGAVLATLLSQHGREHGTEDLAERFLVHAVVDQARDLELAVASGLEIDEQQLAAACAERREVVRRYGRMFAKDYGWARPLFPQLGPKEQVTFERLEELANTGLHRLDYRLGGHYVHSSAWTVVLSSSDRAGRTYRLTGPTNVGLGPPAAVALDAILVSTMALFFGIASSPEPLDLAGCEALRILSDQAEKLFAEGQMLVDKREARLEEGIRRRSPPDCGA